MRSASASACGKFILAGEHFVVHGVPAIAMPLFARRTQVRVELRDVAGDVVLSALEPAERVLAEHVVAAARERLAPEAGGVVVTVESDLPIGFGLGSSAAFSTALVRALAAAVGLELGTQAVLDVAYGLEEIVHGRPSGVDNAVVAFERPVLFRPARAGGGAGMTHLRARHSMDFVLASCGYAGSTLDAVAGVSALAKRSPEAFAAQCAGVEALVGAAAAAFERGDREALGQAVSANHALLVEIGVSTPELDGLVAAARGAGALGAKLTGAGCGGFILALVAPGQHAPVADACRRAGAAHVFHTAASG